MSQLNPTIGELRVGWDFVPTGNDFADGMKSNCAAQIDLISQFKDLDPDLANEAQDAFAKACELSVRFFNTRGLITKKNK